MSSKKIIILLSIVLLSLVGFLVFRKVETFNPNTKHQIGDVLDSLNGVLVYYNGGVGHVGKRNTSEDGYNIGLNYQCVEFVKRYYYQYYHHQMPDSYGNAKDFFDASVLDGDINKKRDLMQCTNPSNYKPQVGDLVVFDGHIGNHYGHVAIVANVNANQVEIIQQNPGPFAPSRILVSLDSTSNGFKIQKNRLLGWLRMHPTL